MHEHGRKGFAMRFARTAAGSALVALICGAAIAGENPLVLAHEGYFYVNGKSTTVNGHDYITREITIAPGGSTGWHWHDGKLIGVIKQGTLTHSSANCSVDGVYNPGDPVTEPAGPEHVHLGRNLGTTPLILEIIYVNPVGKPLAEDAANPGCPFA